ncbi:MAG: Gfo/Idh/MocA family oxidoreductase [Armatimonadota bacterium]
MNDSGNETLSGLSRRDFLRGSAAAIATAGLATSAVAAKAPAKPAAKPAPKPIANPAVKPPSLMRAAIIGTGSQGTLLLNQALKAPGVKFVATCDIYPPHLEKSLILADGAEGYEDYRKLLERKDIDAVIIATPLHMHAPIAIDALNAGKNVFCEKMMAITIEDAKQMGRTARDTKKLLQVGHQRRVNDTYTRGFQAIHADNALGKITQVRAQWHRNGSWRRAIPDPKFEQLLNWRMYKEYSHGLMSELGSHQMDVVNWFLKGTPISVVAMGGIDYWKDGRTTYDNISVIYEYPDGVKATYTAITTNEYDQYTEEFMGDQGTIILSPEKGLLFREAKAEKLIWAPMSEKETSKGKEAIVLDAQATRSDRTRATGKTLAAKEMKNDYYVELEQFFDSVRTGSKPACGPEEALQACVVSIMANKAVETGEKLKFTPDMFTY